MGLSSPTQPPHKTQEHSAGSATALSASQSRATGIQMKTITLRIPDVEAAMLVEVQKRNKSFRDLRGYCWV